MRVDYHDFAELERANYAAMQPMVEVTPGMELIIRPDVLLISNPALPMPDANHACLLQTTSEAAPALMDEITAYFRSKGVMPTVYLSPACKPANLDELLTARGFTRQAEQEAWAILEGKEAVRLAGPSPQVEVRCIDEEDADIFADVFLRAFEFPSDFVPLMAGALRPSMHLENVRHYVAFTDGKPVGVCTRLSYQNMVIFGSAGILPVRRGRKVLETMMHTLYDDAVSLKAEVGLLQTTAGGLFQRFLHIIGWETMFIRTCYVLP